MMALTYDGMPCSLCGEPIVDPSRDTFCLTMWGIDDGRFMRLDDSACHQSCIDSWEHRDAFIEYYNHNCKDELVVDRAGHVRYRYEYAHWAMSAFVMTLGTVCFLPSLALLEFAPSNRFLRIVFCIAPFFLLGTLAWVLSDRLAITNLLVLATILWTVISAASGFIVARMPVHRARRQR